MKKAKKIIDEWVEIMTLVLPISWVLACFDGEAEYLLNGDFVRFFGSILVCCFCSSLLLGVGFLFSGLTLKKDEAAWLPFGGWRALGIEILILLWITLYIPTIDPRDVI